MNKHEYDMNPLTYVKFDFVIIIAIILWIITPYQMP